MFGITTHKQLPDEYLNSYSHWDTCMATVWAALLLEYQLAPNMTVIEIAPGTSTKIGLALQKCLFQGKLYLVEPSEKSLSILYNRYKSILPNTEIYPIPHTLLNSIDYLPKNSDFILSNHPLDDMLIANQWANSNQSSLFDWALSPSGEISALFLEQWLSWTSDLSQLYFAKRDVIRQWQQFFLQVKSSVTLISQYPSITLQKNQLQDLNEHASDILNGLKNSNPVPYQQIQSILNQLENYNNKHIATEVLNAKNWFVAIANFHN